MEQGFSVWASLSAAALRDEEGKYPHGEPLIGWCSILPVLNVVQQGCELHGQQRVALKLKGKALRSKLAHAVETELRS